MDVLFSTKNVTIGPIWKVSEQGQVPKNSERSIFSLWKTIPIPLLPRKHPQIDTTALCPTKQNQAAFVQASWLQLQTRIRVGSVGRGVQQAVPANHQAPARVCPLQSLVAGDKGRGAQAERVWPHQAYV